MDLDVESPGRAADDALELALGVEVQPVDGAEAVAERAAQQALPRGGADTREVRQRQRGRARADALAQNRVEAEVFERRIQGFLDDAVHAVDLVDEEDIARSQIAHDRAKSALAVDRGSRA